MPRIAPLSFDQMEASALLRREGWQTGMRTNISPKVSGRPDIVPLLARCIAFVGVARFTTGVVAWLTVRSQLAAEKIVVPESADRFAGRRVGGPLTAFEEANVIKRIALKATGGRTYGEMDENDPAAHMAMEASLLRSSLFTSILAFGVAASEVVIGGLEVVIGAALSSMARRIPPQVG